MIATAFVPLAVILLFLLAFALPQRICIAASRAVSGVAVAVQVVAFILFLVLSAGDYSPLVLLWIAIGWIVFPLAATVLGLALSLAHPPRVTAMWIVALVLFAISLPILLNDGAFVAPSALLMFLSSIFALGAHFDATTRTLESTSG